MTGIYDQLRDQLGDDDDRPSGMTTLDIADLPAAQRRVMFTLLRDSEAAVEGITLVDLAARLADTARPEGAPELAETLDDLTQQGWLILRGEPPRARYKVNLRRRERSGGRGLNVWALLTDRLTPDEDSEDDDSHDSASQQPGHDRPNMADW